MLSNQASRTATAALARAGAAAAARTSGFHFRPHGPGCACGACAAKGLSNKARCFSAGAPVAPPPERDPLKRLRAGEVVVGDGGFVFALEKRGYVKAGPWTPEAVIEQPDGVRQLHREFMRAGSDVMQTFTFYASEDKLQNRGNDAAAKYTCRGINAEACRIAREVAEEGNGLGHANVMVAGGVCQTPTYLSGGGKAAVQKEFDQQMEMFVENKVDFMICEYFEHVEEIEWSVEAVRKYAPNLPVAANMCIGPEGDLHGNTTEDCAVRMYKAGAQIIGVNCHFDPFVSLEAMRKVKAGLEGAGVKINPKDGEEGAFLMVQPLAYMTPDANKQGFIDLPEFPFGLEPRVLTRWEIARYAREAHDLGVRYIGGCCAFEPYHIRALSDELTQERGGKRPLAGDKWLPGAGGLDMHTKPWVRARATRAYWDDLVKDKIASGRPACPTTSRPDGWGVTQGDDILKQQREGTTADELTRLREKQRHASAS